MFVHDELIAWLESEKENAIDLIKCIEDGKVSFRSKDGDNPWEDTTQSTLHSQKTKLEKIEPQLKRLLAEKEKNQA